MPKLIEGLRENIIENARKRLLEEGYDNFSIRLIAKDCGIAVGTVYNYFPAKEDIISEIMLDDWNTALKLMDIRSKKAVNVKEIILNVYLAIDDFCHSYKNVWNSYNKEHKSITVTAKRHLLLRSQIKDSLSIGFKTVGRTDLVKMADILAESILATAMWEDISKEELEMIADKL